MITLVRELCERLRLGYALHTGSVPQRRRRAEIQVFKSDPNCRVFLSTDSGSTGLNLQNASVVINCDLPWNPAKLEQRIARAWRKHQARPVTVIHLVSENTIEHRMLDTLATKQALADGVLELRGDLKEIKFRSGRQAMLSRLEQLLSQPTSAAAPAAAQQRRLPRDRSLAFSLLASEKLGGSLIRCEERYPLEGAHTVLVAVVDRDAALWREKLASLHEELFGPGKSDPLAPTMLQVIDRATDEALKQMIEAGLVTPAIRAARDLFPSNGHAKTPVPLSDEEMQKSVAHRQQAGRKLKMARLLLSGEMLEEARESLLEAIHWLSRALAVENRAPEPESTDDAVIAPASLWFGESIAAIREFVKNEDSPAVTVVDALQWIIEVKDI